MRTYKKKDKTMLCGFDEHDTCLDCGMKRFSIKMKINIILKMIAKDLMKKRENLTSKDILQAQKNLKYFSREINLKECKELIANPDKYI